MKNIIMFFLFSKNYVDNNISPNIIVFDGIRLINFTRYENVVTTIRIPFSFNIRKIFIYFQKQVVKMK